LPVRRLCYNNSNQHTQLWVTIFAPLHSHIKIF
jgi:hypothetical protein